MRGLVNGLKQRSIENNPDWLHLSILFHNVLHRLTSGYAAIAERLAH